MGSSGCDELGHLHGAVTANAAAVRGLKVMLLGTCTAFCCPVVGARIGRPVRATMLHKCIGEIGQGCCLGFFWPK